MAKGSDWERDACRLITEWLTLHLEEEERRNPPELWRTEQSGGWKYGEEADLLDLAPKGDLGEEFRHYFAVECKWWQDIQWWHLWTSGSEARWFYKGWIEPEQEVEGYDIQPMLLFKQNHRPVLVGVRPELYEPPGGVPDMVASEQGYSVRLFPFEHWKTLHPEDLYSRCEDLSQ